MVVLHVFQLISGIRWETTKT